ncbi:DUF5707 domain-containing protein [Streptomyces poonensis]|uniref:Calcium-binding protein n=1 Tax=Streptomyces poonensis TaxID=68255 RepID=A0A918UD76_9ACTN|nr:DUF5707 domain-containing protein [Streptomyces poonensis]GGY95100.1 hypothetical protein GCM10010365_12420 [Streptomyces poonensis]GLJ88773.1 hypothetical protein GCM10017589_13730 [Streptomyces poonensis]
MRIRATVAAVSGALALSALAVPAAQADEVPETFSAAAAVGSKAGSSSFDDSYGDTKVSNVVVNGGKAVVFGTSAGKTVKVTFTATDNSGIKQANAILWHGSSVDEADGGAITSTPDSPAKCTKVTSTKSTCVANFAMKPTTHLVNDLAGTWKVFVAVQAKDGNYVIKENAKSFKIQRASKLTVNATPEPVKNGKTITVTGSLTRANWDTHKYAGYTQQSVKLQFKKKGTSTYKTVKTVKSGTGKSAGVLKTTVKASVDGTYRYSFAGSSTSPAVSSSGDAVDVK